MQLALGHRCVGEKWESAPFCGGCGGRGWGSATVCEERRSWKVRLPDATETGNREVVGSRIYAAWPNKVEPMLDVKAVRVVWTKQPKPLRA